MTKEKMNNGQAKIFRTSICLSETDFSIWNDAYQKHGFRSLSSFIRYCVEQFLSKKEE